jgi:hypothetical protein
LSASKNEETTMKPSLIAVLIAAATLVACGGGGSSSMGGAQPPAPPPSAMPPAPQDLVAWTNSTLTDAEYAEPRDVNTLELVDGDDPSAFDANF